MIGTNQVITDMSGQIFAVGIGPGGLEHLTIRAQEVIQMVDVVIGYELYIQLIAELISDQEVLSSPMKQEMERVELALALVQMGKKVALISSGDAGVYGMAGPVYEKIKELKIDIEVEVIPGVTSILSAAATLGAPLMHDFVVISLSDLLTPWDKIVKRLHVAGEGDFCIGIYNPRSKKRQMQLVQAQEILLKYRSSDTPVGIVWNSTRVEEQKLITTLGQIPHDEIDMFTILLIGNSETYKYGNWMITPRGYGR